MKEFVPSDSFVERTMDAVRACKAAEIRKRSTGLIRFQTVLLQAGALAAGLAMAAVNAVRLYYAVFAPVISQ
jgi:hypothetical protein